MKKLLYFCLFCVSMMIVSCEGFGPSDPSGESNKPSIPVSPDKPSTPDKEGEEEQQPISPEDPCLTDNVVFVEKPFSISETAQVIFSPGNLQYHPLSQEWRFAPSQFCFIGADNANISLLYQGWIDLFGNGTGFNPTNNSMDYQNDYNNLIDWGINKIGDYAPETWRTLNNEELRYLLEERTDASNLYCTAKINGVTGLVLLPDNWETPSGLNFKSGVYKPAEDTSIQTFTTDEWIKLAESGAVFMPCAGNRAGVDVKWVGVYGMYWCLYDDGYDGTSKEYLHIGTENVSIGLSPRNIGASVRLVRDL